MTSLYVYNWYWIGGATIKLVWLWCQHNLKNWHETFKQRVGSDFFYLVSEYVFYESRIIFLSLSKISFTHIGLIWYGCHTVSICKLCVKSWRFVLYWATSSLELYSCMSFIAEYKVILKAIVEMAEVALRIGEFTKTLLLNLYYWTALKLDV